MPGLCKGYGWATLLPCAVSPGFPRCGLPVLPPIECKIRWEIRRKTFCFFGHFYSPLLGGVLGRPGRHAPQAHCSGITGAGMGSPVSGSYCSHPIEINPAAHVRPRSLSSKETVSVPLRRCIITSSTAPRGQSSLSLRHCSKQCQSSLHWVRNKGRCARKSGRRPRSPSGCRSAAQKQLRPSPPCA